MVVTALAVIRAVVSFAEAFATVSTSRTQDREQLAVCESGSAASTSARFRSACLEAKADLASPIFFKAILLAVSNSYHDFAELAGSPVSCLSLVLFAVLSLASPTRGVLDFLTGGGRDDAPSHNHVVIVAGEDYACARTPRGVRYLKAGARAVRGALRLSRKPRGGGDRQAIVELGGADDGAPDNDGYYALSLGHEKWE